MKIKKILISMLLILVLILIILLMLKFKEEAKISNLKLENINKKVTILEEKIENLYVQDNLSESSTNAIEQDLNLVNTNNDEIVYEELTEKIYKKMCFIDDNYIDDYLVNYISSDKYLNIHDIVDNKDGSVSLKMRYYEKVECPNLSKNDMKKLKETGKINLLGLDFSLINFDEYEEAYLITNDSYVSLYVSEDGKTKPYPLTTLVKGTDEYFYITCDKNIKVNYLPDDIETNVLEMKKYNDQEYFCISTLMSLKFENEILCGIDITW